MHDMNPLGPLLGHCSHLACERLDARLAQYDVTPAQIRVLHYLYHHNDQAPQCDVTTHLKVKPSTANGILDRMEEKEMLMVAGLEEEEVEQLHTLLHRIMTNLEEDRKI